jgi:hypothetical protein
MNTRTGALTSADRICGADSGPLAASLNAHPHPSRVASAAHHPGDRHGTLVTGQMQSVTTATVRARAISRDDTITKEAVVGRGVPKKIGVKVNLGIAELSGEWEPNDIERAAAWELYVELITRISVVPIQSDSDVLLREALTSLYSIFKTTRDVLRRYGPDIAEPKPSGQYNFAYLAIAILNGGIRPLLSRWHPALKRWEEQCPTGTSPAAHEHAWPHAAELRADLDQTRHALTDYAATLAIACGVPNLLDD